MMFLVELRSDFQFGGDVIVDVRATTSLLIHSLSGFIKFVNDN